MNVGETQASLVEETYKETTGVEGERPEQFGVDMGLRQGSALSALLFIMKMKRIIGNLLKKGKLTVHGQTTLQ